MIVPQPSTTVLDFTEGHRYIGITVISCGYVVQQVLLRTGQLLLLQVHLSSTGCNIIFNGDRLGCSVTVITTCICSCPGSGDRSATIHHVLAVSLNVTGTSVSQLSVAVTVGAAGIQLHTEQLLSLQVHLFSTGCNIILTVMVWVNVTCITTSISSSPGSGDRSATIHHSVRSFTEGHRYIGIAVISCRYSWQQLVSHHTGQ